MPSGSKHKSSLEQTHLKLRSQKISTEKNELIIKHHKTGASPMAEWLSSGAPLPQPRVSPLQILGTNGMWHRSSGHLETACLIAQPEGPTIRIYTYVLGGLGRRRRRKQRRLATDISSGAKSLKKKIKTAEDTKYHMDEPIEITIFQRLQGKRSESSNKKGRLISVGVCFPYGNARRLRRATS